MKTRRGKKIKVGFTIIEALIAVTVLTVGFVSVIQIFPGVIGLNSRSKDLTIASHLAEMKLEEFIATPYTQLTIGTQPTNPIAFNDEGFNKYKWQVEITKPPELTDIKQIEVTVYWGNNNQYNTDLVTYQTK